METEFFFVYGTLKKGGVFAEHFNGYRVSSEKATINNMNLYSIGWFPGILPGNGTVIGELHEYKEPKTVTTLMDQIEGYNKANPKQSLFIRKYVTVVTKTDKEIKAVVYIYNNPKHVDLKQIHSGIWDQ